VPDLPRLRRRAPRSSACRVKHPRRGRAPTAAGSGSPARASPAGAGWPARRPLPDHPRSAPSRVFKRKGDNFEIEVPLTIPEALRGAEVQVPTLNGSKTLRVAPGTAARHRPASAAARARPSSTAARRRRSAATLHYRFRDRRAQGAQLRPAEASSRRCPRCSTATPPREAVRRKRRVRRAPRAARQADGAAWTW